jgi:hypothetical protein
MVRPIISKAGAADPADIFDLQKIACLREMLCMKKDYI